VAASPQTPGSEPPETPLTATRKRSGLGAGGVGAHATSNRTMGNMAPIRPVLDGSASTQRRPLRTCQETSQNLVREVAGRLEELVTHALACEQIQDADTELRSQAGEDVERRNHHPALQIIEVVPAETHRRRKVVRAAPLRRQQGPYVPSNIQGRRIRFQPTAGQFVDASRSQANESESSACLSRGPPPGNVWRCFAPPPEECQHVAENSESTRCTVERHEREAGRLSLVRSAWGRPEGPADVEHRCLLRPLLREHLLRGDS